MNIDYPSLLNSTQLQAVTTPAQHVRIIAGAGSGKTRVLTYRIAYLIDKMNVDPSKILAVTFTNKAANEMKTRVGRLIPEAKNFLHVSTIHSFCASFLRKECGYLGYPRSFSIIDEEDQEKLIKEIGQGRGYKKSDALIKEAVHYVRYNKMRGIYPDDITLKYEHFVGEKECLIIYALYEEQKTRQYCLDFDDLILQTINILTAYPEARERWSSYYTHILVDEFQDTNDAEYKLFMLLLKPSSSFYVVGDPDQTIYTWRGANQKIILAFPKNFEDAVDIILDRNYRSTEKILEKANKLIAHNTQRVPKKLYTEEKGGQDVTARKFQTEQDEARWVLSEISKLCQDGDYTKVALLYRSSYQTRPFESTFASNGIPYRIFGGQRFYQRMEIKDVEAYFRLLTNQLDDIAFDRIVNVPRRGIGEKTHGIIKHEAAERGMSEYNYMISLGKNSDTEIPNKNLTALMVLATQMEMTRAKLNERTEAYSGILKDFITGIGYFDYLTQIEETDEDRVGNVNAFFDDISNYLTNNPDSTLEEYLQNISLLSGQDDMNNGNYVTFSTVHLAKGLEFENVFMVGLNEGSFPNARAIDEEGRDGMEEERRLCYVGMTRAKKRLYLTCNSGYSYVTNGRGSPSPFFAEADTHFPLSDMRVPYMGGGYRGDFQKRSGSSSFFSDGGHIDGFESPSQPKIEEKKVEQPANGITDWAVGDRVRHTKFGEGVVCEVVSSKIIIVDFKDQGKKTLVSTHPAFTRLPKEGGYA